MGRNNFEIAGADWKLTQFRFL